MKEQVIAQYATDANKILERHSAIMNHKKRHRIPQDAWKRQMECCARRLQNDLDRLLGSYADAGYEAGIKMMELARITRPMKSQFLTQFRHSN